MECTDGETYVQEYNGINGIDPDDFWFRFTVDGCHLEFDNVLGADDNTTGWWGAHSENLQVPAGKTVTTQFINYTNGASNWNNFCVVLCREDASEYGVVRADNYGWGDGYAGIAIPTMEEGRDWATWLKAMDEAKVTLSVTNLGNGKSNVNAIMVGNDGKTYTQSYTGIETPDVDNVYFNLTIDNSHLVFEPVARNAVGAKAKKAARRPVVYKR